MPVYPALIVALVLPAAAFAQGGPAAPALLRHTGEEVIVTQSASGQELRGHIVELSPTTLAMLVDGKRMEVPIERVLRIEGQNDSVKNGAAIGAAVMGGLTVLGCGQSLGRSGVCVTAAILYTGMGALMGAGVDALHKGRTTIYSKPAAVALAVAPAGKGARLQLKLSF
jgi:fermentation-respiration switch protein FrsA (DUF1100 family)